jgi:glycosyltransferase involved in cell wall biosynthesis
VKTFLDILRVKPKIVVVLNGPDVIALPAIFYRLMNRSARFIWDIRSRSLMNAKRTWWYYPFAKLLDWIVPKFADIVTTNRYVYREKRDYCFLQQCVDEELFDPQIKSKLEKPDKKIILFVGAFVKKEGVDFLIKSFKKYQREDVELWVIGSGKDERMFRGLIDDERIKTLGRLPHKEIQHYIRVSDVCVCPLSGKSEAIADESLYSILKLGEYMAMEKPILCSDVGYLKETAKGTNIVFYEDDNEKDFLEKLDSCLEKPVKTKLPEFLQKEAFLENLKSIILRMKENL